MIALDDSLYISQGEARAVYRHPHHADRCIKIPHPTHVNHAGTKREVRYWQRWRSLGHDVSRLPRFYHWEQTNLGRGVVWDLVRNYDGSISQTLEGALSDRSVGIECCRAELATVKVWMLDNRVLLSDLHASNLLCQFDAAGEFRLVLIDGWGNSEFVPVSSVFAWLGRRKIERKWTYLRRQMDMLYQRYQAEEQLEATDDEPRDILPFPTPTTVEAPTDASRSRRAA